VLTHTEAKGIDFMGTTELQGTSKRIRIVLCLGVVLGATAVMPAAGLAADWSSKAGTDADWSSKLGTDADWSSKISPNADWSS
jgi:hypothetical protein